MPISKLMTFFFPVEMKDIQNEGKKREREREKKNHEQWKPFFLHLSFLFVSLLIVTRRNTSGIYFISE